MKALREQKQNSANNNEKKLGVKTFTEIDSTREEEESMLSEYLLALLVDLEGERQTLKPFHYPESREKDDDEEESDTEEEKKNEGEGVKKEETTETENTPKKEGENAEEKKEENKKESLEPEQEKKEGEKNKEKKETPTTTPEILSEEKSEKEKKAEDELPESRAIEAFPLSKKFRAIIEQIFTKYTGSLNGVMGPREFNKLQQCGESQFVENEEENFLWLLSQYPDDVVPYVSKPSSHSRRSSHDDEEKFSDTNTSYEDSDEEKSDREEKEEMRASTSKIRSSSISSPPTSTNTETPTSTSTTSTTTASTTSTTSSTSPVTTPSFIQIEIEGEGESVNNKEKENKEYIGKGLNLNGFIKLYTYQANLDPIETFEELKCLGYDLHLRQSNHSSVRGATRAILGSTRSSSSSSKKNNNNSNNYFALLEQLIEYSGAIFYSLPSLSSPLALKSSHILPITPNTIEATTYPQLANIDCRTIRLYFEILRQFNELISHSLQYINLSGSSITTLHLFQMRSLIFHPIKMKFFFEVLEKTSVEGSQPTVSINRLQIASKKNQLLTKTKKEGEKDEERDEWVLSNTAFGLAFLQLSELDPVSLRQKKPSGNNPHFSLNVEFEGENVEGVGGPYRQFFTDISKELEDTNDEHMHLPLFIPCPNSKAGYGSNQDKFLVNPNSRNFKFFRFFGRLVGIAIRTGVLLTLDLPTFFWKPLIGIKPDINDLRAVDTSFVEHCIELLNCSKDSFDDIMKPSECFEVPMSDPNTFCSLKSGGENIKMSFENKGEWVALALNTRLNESTPQIDAIRQGISDIIPLALLSLCTPQDIEWRVCGKPNIDIDLLQRNTQYSPPDTANSPHIIYFWKVLHSLTQEERKKFIRFAWAQERLPSDDQEFVRTAGRMLIKPYTGTSNPDKVFIRADTCFFHLTVPEYSSPEILKERLLMAIHTDSDSMNADVLHTDSMRGAIEARPLGGGREIDRHLGQFYDYIRQL
jgi:hypothetical protein